MAQIPATLKPNEFTEDRLEAGPAAENTLVPGTVTFLDVLGWKGIWLRHDSTEVVGRLTELVDLAKELLRGADATEVLSISDTIVLLTKAGVGEDALRRGVDLHGRIAAELVCRSIALGLPLRGATAVGDFLLKPPSMMVGPAVDESASWHEATDWIGVVQTPSALMLDSANSEWWARYVAPVKGGSKWKLPCVNWPKSWPGGRQELLSRFAEMAPFDVGISGKYLNTLQFFDELHSGDRPPPPPMASVQPAPVVDP